jgi:hypothetical protein
VLLYRGTDELIIKVAQFVRLYRKAVVPFVGAILGRVASAESFPLKPSHRVLLITIGDGPELVRRAH